MIGYQRLFRFPFKVRCSWEGVMNENFGCCHINVKMQESNKVKLIVIKVLVRYMQICIGQPQQFFKKQNKYFQCKRKLTIFIKCVNYQNRFPFWRTFIR